MLGGMQASFLQRVPFLGERCQDDLDGGRVRNGIDRLKIFRHRDHGSQGLFRNTKKYGHEQK